MKYLLALVLLFGAYSVKAAPPGQTFSATRTSFTVNALGPTLFSSATIQFIAVNISSSAGDGRLTIYRSTGPTFTLDVSSQTVIYTGGNINQTGNLSIPLYDLTNTSYTYIQKHGQSEITIFFRCLGQTNVGNCPGLGYTAQK